MNNPRTNKHLAGYLSKKIIKLRKSVGWSQSELARKTGVTSAAINLIEKGNRIPSLIVCQKIAEALNVSIAELTGRQIPSSTDLNLTAQNFFRRYKDIVKLSLKDQKIIRSLIVRLLEENHYEN